MHPIVFNFMIKERIRDMTVELEKIRMIEMAEKEVLELKKINKETAVKKAASRSWWFPFRKRAG